MQTSHSTDRLAGLTLGVAVIGTEALVISPVLGDIARTFQVSNAQAAWAVTAYGLTLALVAPSVGWFGHRLSRKATLLAGLGTLVFAGLICAWSPVFWILLVGRATCGAAAGAFLPACYAYVGDTTSYERRGRAMGRVMAGWSIALIVGVPLGAAIAQCWGWRATFVVVSGLASLALLLVARLSHVAAAPRLHETSVLARGVPLLLAVNFFNVLSFYGIYTFLGVVVRERLGLAGAAFGVVVICYGMGLLVSTLNARLLDRFGQERALTLGLSMLVIQLVLLAPAVGHPWALALAMLLWGVSQGFVQTATATLVTQASGGARGLAMACLSSGSYLAVGLGSLGGGWLLEYSGFTTLALAGAATVSMALLLLRRYVAMYPAP